MIKRKGLLIIFFFVSFFLLLFFMLNYLGIIDDIRFSKSKYQLYSTDFIDIKEVSLDSYLLLESDQKSRHFNFSKLSSFPYPLFDFAVINTTTSESPENPWCCSDIFIYDLKKDKVLDVVNDAETSCHGPIFEAYQDANLVVVHYLDEVQLTLGCPLYREDKIFIFLKNGKRSLIAKIIRGGHAPDFKFKDFFINEDKLCFKVSDVFNYGGFSHNIVNDTFVCAKMIY